MPSPPRVGCPSALGPMTPPEAPPRLAQVEQADGVICVLRPDGRRVAVAGAPAAGDRRVHHQRDRRAGLSTARVHLAELGSGRARRRGRPLVPGHVRTPPDGKGADAPATRSSVAWSAVVIAGVWALGSWYYVTIDFAPFLRAMLIGEMTSTAGGRFGAVVLAICVAGMLYSTTVQHRSGNLIWVFGFAIGWMGGMAYRTQVRFAFELAEAQDPVGRTGGQGGAPPGGRRHPRSHRPLAGRHHAAAHRRPPRPQGRRRRRGAGGAGRRRSGRPFRHGRDPSHRGPARYVRSRQRGATHPQGSRPACPVRRPTSATPDWRSDFELEGNLAACSLAAGLLASYRVVQESLSNAVKHAPGAPVQLRVTVTEADIRINVVNPVAVGAVRWARREATACGGCQKGRSSWEARGDGRQRQRHLEGRRLHPLVEAQPG